MATLKDVVNLQKRQLNRQSELKKTLLKRTADRINHLSKHGQLKCIYTVPSYCFGYATYNVEDMTNYLLNEIIKQGYCVIKLNDSNLFISWDIKDVNSLRNKIKKEKNNLESLLPILNIK